MTTITTSMKQTNFFKFVTKETSHSAFWAWILQSLSAPDETDLKEAQQIAQNLLAKINLQPPQGRNISVRTEEKLPKYGRADIIVRYDDKVVLGIENKVKACSNSEQINLYKQSYPNAAWCILETGFDYGQAENTRKNGTTYIGLTEISKIIENIQDNSHPLIRDYKRWISDKMQTISDRTEAATTNDCKIFNEYFEKYEETKWVLAKSLFGTNNLEHFHNNGGSTCVQYCFLRLENLKEPEKYDGLLWRFDHSTKGNYISLRQYNNTDKKDENFWNEKKDRLSHLRKMWENLTENSGLRWNTSPQKTNKQTQQESEIAWLIISNQNLPAIRKKLPRLHKKFVSALREEQWPIDE